MATEYGAKTVGDMLYVSVFKLVVNQVDWMLSSVTLEEMQRHFGEESIWVYNILRVCTAFLFLLRGLLLLRESIIQKVSHEWSSIFRWC